MIPIAKPIFGNEEKEVVRKVLNSGMLAQGSWAELFEKKFARFVGTKYAVATSSGTSALYITLLALGIGKGDQVITTPFSFFATSSVISLSGATPVFVDIEKETFNLNPQLLEKSITSKTKAVMPVHLFGLPANMPEITKIAKKHNLYMIEDAAQSHGAEINKKRTGSFGIASCFSFYPTKNMTTGEGGMITTNNKRLANKTSLLRNHGSKTQYRHDILGFNFRMTNIEAAIGLEQLKKLNSFNRRRINNAKYLTRKLSNIKEIITPSCPRGCKHIYHQYTIQLNTKNSNQVRERLVKHLISKGVGNKVYYPIPLHLQPANRYLGHKRGAFLIAEKKARQVISLPVHPSLSNKDLETIVEALQSFFVFRS